MARYRFLLTPRWILLTVLVAAAVVVMVRLGLWQVDRLHGRRDANAAIAERWTSPEVPLGSILPAGAPPAVAQDVVWRQVSVSGTYRPGDQVLVRNRTQSESAGYWVLTPLATDDGRTVVVNRGWVPITIGEGPAPAYAPPDGSVTVTGLVRDTERKDSTIGPTDPPEGRLTTLSRVDLERLGAQLPYRIEPVWVQLTTQQPGQSGPLPMAVPRPELDDGPHLNYAGQWFIYATLTIIVFPLAVRRAARAREARAAAEAAAAGGGAGPGTGPDGPPESSAAVEPGPSSAPAAPVEPVA